MASILREILAIQLALSVICFVIQVYALCSTTWAHFESHIELGIPEEHGHYGLWTICTSKLVPEEISEEGEYLSLPASLKSCEPIDILFKPAHNRTFIAGLAILHAVSLGVYAVIMMFKVFTTLWCTRTSESLLQPDSPGRNEQKVAQNILVNTLARFPGLRFFISESCDSEQEFIKKRIRVRLYVISVAAASTSLAVMFAIVNRRPLRDSDPFQINLVSTLNYRVWRGSGFWAQLTTLVLDMLITSLIAIEVRVLFVLQSPLTRFITRTCGTDISLPVHLLPQSAVNHRDIITDSDDNYETQEVIVNPFFQAESFGTLNSSRHSREREREIEETAISMHETRHKLPTHCSASSSASSSSSTSFPSGEFTESSLNRSLYINSIEVRRLKNKNSQSLTTTTSDNDSTSTVPATSAITASYSNPMFQDS